MSNDTLFGQRILNVTFEDTRTAEMVIKQFRVKQYQQAFPLMDDEIGLIALASGNVRGFVEMLHPKSFEEAIKAVQEVNAEGFFVWSARQMERGAKAMQSMPAELLERAMKMPGRGSALPTPSPSSPRTVG